MNFQRSVETRRCRFPRTNFLPWAVVATLVAAWVSQGFDGKYEQKANAVKFGDVIIGGTITTDGAEVTAGVIAPVAFTGAQVDNYSPPGLATARVLSQDASADTVVTGIAAQAIGFRFNFHNISTHQITLLNLGGSAIGNQFNFPQGSWILPPGAAVDLRYNGTNWRMFNETTGFPLLAVTSTQATTATGTQSNFPLDPTTGRLLVNSASAVTFTGFTGGREGRVLFVEVLGGGNAVFSNKTGSSNENQIIVQNAASATLNSGSAGNGTAGWFVYDATQLKWIYMGSSTGTFANLQITTGLIMSGTSHLRSTGNSPTTDAACKSGVGYSIIGGDPWFKVTTGSTAATCKITFNQAYTTNPPVCVIFTEGSATPPTCTIGLADITCTTVASGTPYNVFCGAPN